MRLYSYSILHFHDVEGLGRDQVFLKKNRQNQSRRGQAVVTVELLVLVKL